MQDFLPYQVNDATGVLFILVDVVQGDRLALAVRVVDHGGCVSGIGNGGRGNGKGSGTGDGHDTQKSTEDLGHARTTTVPRHPTRRTRA